MPRDTWIAGHRRSRKTTACCWHEDADCPPNIQLFRGQDLCSCRNDILEQLAVRLTKSRLVILPVQAVAEDIFSRTTDHGTLWTLFTAPCRNILTYLLTYSILNTVLARSLICGGRSFVFSCKRIHAASITIKQWRTINSERLASWSARLTLQSTNSRCFARSGLSGRCCSELRSASTILVVCPVHHSPVHAAWTLTTRSTSVFCLPARHYSHYPVTVLVSFGVHYWDTLPVSRKADCLLYRDFNFSLVHIVDAVQSLLYPPLRRYRCISIWQLSIMETLPLALSTLLIQLGVYHWGYPPDFVSGPVFCPRLRHAPYVVIGRLSTTETSNLAVDPVRCPPLRRCPRGVSSRFVASVWALFAVVFTASYTANLAAFMITKQDYDRISGVNDPLVTTPSAIFIPTAVPRQLHLEHQVNK